MAVNFFPESSGGSGGGVSGDYIPLTQKGQAGGVATLDSTSKIPQSQLPDISITDTHVVASQAEMLALTAQPGDVAIRTDTSNTYILKTSPASTLANWILLPTPSDGVFSVDGRIGAVTLTDLYQSKSNELTALSGLSDVPGFIKKTGDGLYSIDPSTYLTTTSASASYQPLNSNLTSISGLNTDGILTRSGGNWVIDTSSYQPLDQDLTAIATLSTTGYLEKTGVNTWRTVAGPFQPFDQDLTDISALSGANGIIRKTAGVWSLDTNNYQIASNELSGISALADTPGLIRKTGDGAYALDSNTYLTTTSASTSYQPLNTHLTGISGVTGTDGILKQTAGVWSLDATAYLTTSVANSTYQPLNAKLTGISGVTGTSGILKQTNGVWSLDTNTYQIASNELTGIASLADTPGLIRKTGDGNYGIDTNTYLTNADMSGYQPLSTNLTSISGISTDGILSRQNGTWTMDTKSYQIASNELSGISALADTPGLIRKTGDGTYSLDSNTYLTTTSASASYQPLNSTLTKVSGVTGTDGILRQTGGTWALDATAYLASNQPITLTGAVTGSGTTNISTTLSNFDASKITSGTIADARLSGAYTGFTNITGSGVSTFGSFKIANTATWDTEAGLIDKTTGGGIRINGIPDIDGGGRKISFSGQFMSGIGISGIAASNRGIAWSSMANELFSLRWLLFPGPSSSEVGADSGSDMTLRSYSDNGVDFFTRVRISRSTGNINIFSSTASTSTTSGAVQIVGGVGVQGSLFANTLNGLLKLNTYTTATRPTPSASTLGQIWLNTSTGKIEYVATATTIQSITSA